jgi:hypothetical protein
MSDFQDHPDIEKLPLQVNGQPVREVVRMVFRDPSNGTPDNISKHGCLALAKEGCLIWNSWRETFPVVGVNSFAATSNYADFSEHNFSLEPIDFRNFIFGDAACFYGTAFNAALFTGARFGVRTSFDRCSFAYDADFREIHVGAESHFTECRFMNPVSFDSSHFGPEIGFEYTTFEKSATFRGVKFAGRTVFDRAVFRIAPEFHRSELTTDTSFDGTEFPRPSRSDDAVRAYRILKLAFSKQQAIREEQRFFRLEMEEETLRETGFKRLCFALYKHLSDFGFSLTRPSILFFAAWLCFASIYGVYSGTEICFSWQDSCLLQTEWLNFSFQQALPLPGFEKPGANTNFHVPIAWLALHKTLSLVALFLFGLALRNLFKLK